MALTLSRSRFQPCLSDDAATGYRGIPEIGLSVWISWQEHERLRSCTETLCPPKDA
jgi:hypothetical protein